MWVLGGLRALPTLALVVPVVVFPSMCSRTLRVMVLGRRSLPLLTLADADFSYTYERVLLTDAATEKGAVCNDGTPGAYYIRPPLQESKENRWLIFHEGGGWCQDDNSCLHRTKKDLGSSKNYPPELFEDGKFEHALFRSLPSYTVVFARYCDGSSWSGDLEDPVKVFDEDTGEDANIYYRGARLFDALFDDLLTNKGLDKADRVIYGGCSAGAITAYIHIDYVRALLPPTTTLSGIADAMFSMHHPGFDSSRPNDYMTLMQRGYQAWNSNGINKRCRDYYGEDDAWMCFYGAIVAQFIETPMFIVNSKYDTYQKGAILDIYDGIHCKPSVAADGTVTLCDVSTSESKEKDDFWRTYGEESAEAIKETIPEWHGAFLTNCPTHCLLGAHLEESAGPDIRLGEALEIWFDSVESAMRGGVDMKKWRAPRWIASQDDKCLRSF